MHTKTPSTQCLQEVVVLGWAEKQIDLKIVYTLTCGYQVRGYTPESDENSLCPEKLQFSHILV